MTVEITEHGRDLDFDNLSRGERNRLILGLSFSFRDIFESTWYDLTFEEPYINLDTFYDDLVTNANESGLDFWNTYAEGEDWILRIEIYSKVGNTPIVDYVQYITFPRADGCSQLGDMNGDGGFNVLDVVTLANCVLVGDCGSDCDSSGNAQGCHGCAGDLNEDGCWNVLDIVTLANCVLVGNCGG